MATEADLIQKFKDLNIPVGADFEELIHEAFIGANLVEQVNSKADDSKVVHKTGAEGISGQKMFDVAPIDKTTGNPYITRDGVPTIDLSNYPTKDQLATKADDSKVAHLSGANNFDTVPTVNNNPLLLASSLPSTLADTTKLSNFTAGLQKGGADVATQSDVTTAISTATANMVDSTKATNFTAGLQSGGVNVATAADLKSIADKAWYRLDNKYITSTYFVSSASTVLYKIDDTNKRLYLQGSIILTTNVTDLAAITLNLGSIVKNVLTFNGSYLGYVSGWKNWTNTTTSAGLTFNPKFGLVQFSGDKANAWESTGPLYVTYDELV